MENQTLTRSEIEGKLIAKAWKDETFKKEFVNDPRKILTKELGIQIPETVEIKVFEETPNAIYMVLPMNPNSEELSDMELEGVAGGFWKMAGLTTVAPGPCGPSM
jgi:type IV secretory pathway VirB4 component